MAINKVEFGGRTLIDLTDTTATADKILTGYGAYGKDGVWVDGTANVSGGGVTPTGTINITTNGTHDVTNYATANVNVGDTPTPTPWTRPSNWPDLSQMDVSSGDIIYMTSYADEARGFCNFYIQCTESYTVDVGTISGTTFIADETYTYSSGSTCKLYYGSANGTYKVLRVTGTNITSLYFVRSSTAVIDSFYGWSNNQGIIDVVGRLPSCTNLYCTDQYNLINFEISDVILTGSQSGIFNNCYSLTSLDVSSWNVSSVTNMSSMFYGCSSLTSLDVSGWSVSRVTNMGSMFYNCYSLTSLDVSSWNMSSIRAASNTASMFYYTYGIHGSITLPSTMTQIGSGCFGYMRSIYEWHFLSTVPPKLASVNAFTNMTDFGGKKIYVPYSADHSVLAAYKSATNWSTYASYMVEESA